MPSLIPRDRDDVTLDMEGRTLRLTNLRKLFWKTLQITKGDLLQYYADVSPWLLPHLHDRPMVMKRYPNGADGDFFYMKRAPRPRPEWIQVCSIPHKSSNVIGFALAQDLASLLWMINLGCIDLNPWYGRCDDWDRPDFLHFDLDPVAGADFRLISSVALKVRELLEELRMPTYAKTTGSRGIHVYVPIRRGPIQKDVWEVAKALALELASRFPKLMTAEYRIAKRPHGRVLVDYNQNAWGRTLASVYSVRPTALATVSAPVTWKELEEGVSIEQFRLETIRGRLHERGDLWKGLLGPNRYDLAPLVDTIKTLRTAPEDRGRAVTLHPSLETTVPTRPSYPTHIRDPSSIQYGASCYRPSWQYDNLGCRPWEMLTMRNSGRCWMLSMAMVVVVAGSFWTAATGRAEEELVLSPEADGVQRVTMIVDSHWYKPKHLVAHAGVPVEITLVSETTLTPHNFVLKEPDAGMNVNQDIGAGKRVTVRFTPMKPGLFTFYCDKRLLFFKSHRDKGMEGTLKVI